MGTELPEYFKCPISLEIMSDPVILTSGHTFDRSSILRWLESGHRSCPITKLPLPHPTPLIPNHALRSLISNYTPHLKIPEPEPNRTEESLTSLITSLTSHKTTTESKLESLSRLTGLTKSDAKFRRRIADSGGLSAVLRCMDSPEMRQRGLSLLLELSLDDDNKVGLVAEGAVAKLVAAVGGGGAGGATAATVLTSLAVVEVNKVTIGAHPGAVSGLVRLAGKGRDRERREAVTALFAICSFPENRRRAVECGAVPILIKMARFGVERAVEVLGLLGKCKEGREEMVKYDGLVEILVGFVRDGSSRGVQYGLLTLNSICCCSERVRDEVRYEGVLEICLGLIEDDNEKIRRVASSLARILQEKDGN